MTPSTPTPLLPASFRDTALTVVTLSGDVSAGSFDGLRQRCQGQIQRLREALTANGQPADVVEDASYAQCALLDEAALRHLHGADREAWEREPLQVSEFGTHHAGDALIERIAERLRQPQPVLPLLAIFHAVLSLGFQGRFALEGRDARAALMRALNERLGPLDMSADGVVVRAGGAPRWWAHLTLPAWVATVALAASVIYVLLDRWLSAAVAHLMP